MDSAIVTRVTSRLAKSGKKRQDNSVRRAAKRYRTTEEFLSRVFGGNNKQLYGRLMFLEQGGFEQPMLSTADINRVITWCCAQRNPTIWQAVATALELFVLIGDDKRVKVNDECSQYVEASSQSRAGHDRPGWTCGQRRLVERSIWNFGTQGGRNFGFRVQRKPSDR